MTLTKLSHAFIGLSVLPALYLNVVVGIGRLPQAAPGWSGFAPSHVALSRPSGDHPYREAR